MRPLRLVRFLARGGRPAPPDTGAPPPPPGPNTVPMWSFRGVTSVVGELRLPVAPTDHVMISFDDPDWHESLNWRGAAAAAAKGNTIVFEKTGSVLVLGLRDDEGKPVPETFVQIIGAPSRRLRGFSTRTRTIRRAWTDSSGNARLGRVPLDWTFRVQFRPGQEGGIRWQNAGSFSVPRGTGDEHAVEVVLPGKQIRGRALNANGTPLSGRVVFVRRPREGRRPLAVTPGVVTSVRGTWSFAGLPTGTYELALVRPGGSGGTPEAVSDSFVVKTSGTTFELRFHQE